MQPTVPAPRRQTLVIPDLVPEGDRGDRKVDVRLSSPRFQGETWLSTSTDVRFWPVGLSPERGSSPSAPPVGFWRHVAPGPPPKHHPVPVLPQTESRPPLPSPVGN